MRVNFSDKSDFIYRAIFRNPRQEGYKPKEWVERRQQATNARFLFGENRIGVAGIGNIDVEAHNGSVGNGMFTLSIAATKISD